ncbi:RNA-directed DNA polymerase, eukaryota [Tanacetum coccineum]
MNCLSLNIQGLGSKAKKDWIKELISKHKVSFLSIQETKMESVSAMEVKFLWGNYFFDHIISEASGNSGGILCAWDTNFFKKDHHTISDNFIALRGSLNFPFPNRLNNDQILELESPISNEDIRTAVWGCGVDKSPGPDGFTFEFFRKYWTVVGPDFCIAVKWFFDHGDFAIGCNSSFVALIPKVLDPKVVSDYRPISLIGSLYKVVTKILASRLSLVISDLISDVQTAFLPNRQILDGPFIINEILARCKLKKQQAMIFKVDFAKAYDSVRWDYLDDVLISFGFGPKWRSWIRGSLSSGKASILVNGSPTTEFHLYRGLKQGDPLAPFLFLLIMESLHLSFSRAVEAAGIFKGYKIDPSTTLSHLFLPDRRGILLGERFVWEKVQGTRFGEIFGWAIIFSRAFFSSLFALEENKDISVADKMNTSISSSFRLIPRSFWDLNGDGVFQVNDVRSMLDEAFLPKMEVPTRWIKSIPIKVNVFAWKLYLDRLPTRSNLSRRNVSLPSLACPLCDHVLEDSSPFNSSVSLAKDIQKLILKLWLGNLDVQALMSRTTKIGSLGSNLSV